MADNKNGPGIIKSTGNPERTEVSMTKTQAEIDRENTLDGDPINLREKVTVFSTDKDPHHTTGEAMSVHPKVAQDLIKNGFAAETEQKAKDWIDPKAKKEEIK